MVQYLPRHACADSQTEFIRPFTDNKELNDTLALFEMPVVSYSTIESDGYGTFLTSAPLTTQLSTTWTQS